MDAVFLNTKNPMKSTEEYEREYLNQLVSENTELSRMIKGWIEKRDINSRIISGLRDRLGIKSGKTDAPELFVQEASKNGEVLASIKEKARLLNGSEITVAAVQVLLPDVSRSTISGALSSMAKSGELKCTQQGIGRRPAIYKSI
jgi:hypothetical protein